VHLARERARRARRIRRTSAAAFHARRRAREGIVARPLRRARDGRVRCGAGSRGVRVAAETGARRRSRQRSELSSRDPRPTAPRALAARSYRYFIHEGRKPPVSNRLFRGPGLYALVLCLLLIVPLAAATDLKLATLVPATSTWHKALLDMGGAWKRDTADRVTLTVYAGGTQGDEATIIRKMRSDIVQSAFITSVGLAELDDAVNVFAIPFFLESSDEEVAVEKKLAPVIDKRLQAKGLHLLCWGTGGWVEVFSKKPLRTLAEVKGAKLFTTKGSDKWIQWY